MLNMEINHYSVTTANDLIFLLQHKKRLLQENIGINIVIPYLKNDGGIIPLLQVQGYGIPIMSDSGAYTAYSKLFKLAKMSVLQKKKYIKEIEQSGNLINIIPIG
jgi:hypothetical protein